MGKSSEKSLPPELREVLKSSAVKVSLKGIGKAHKKAVGYIWKAVKQAVLAGYWVHDLKKKAPHGCFIPAVETELSYPTAYRYQKVYEFALPSIIQIAEQHPGLSPLQLLTGLRETDVQDIFKSIPIRNLTDLYRKIGLVPEKTPSQTSKHDPDLGSEGATVTDAYQTVVDHLELAAELIPKLPPDEAKTIMTLAKELFFDKNGSAGPEFLAHASRIKKSATAPVV